MSNPVTQEYCIIHVHVFLNVTPYIPLMFVGRKAMALLKLTENQKIIKAVAEKEPRLTKSLVVCFEFLICTQFDRYHHANTKRKSRKKSKGIFGLRGT